MKFSRKLWGWIAGTQETLPIPAAALGQLPQPCAIIIQTLIKMFVSSAYSRTHFQIMLRHDIHLYCDGELFYDIVYGKSFDPLPAHFDCRIQPSVQLESAIAGLARDHCPRPRSSSTVRGAIRSGLTLPSTTVFEHCPLPDQAVKIFHNAKSQNRISTRLCC